MTKAWNEKPMDIPICSPVRRKLNLSNFVVPSGVELVKGLGATKKASLTKVDATKKEGDLSEKLVKKDSLPAEDDEKLDKADDLKDQLHKLDALIAKEKKSDVKKSAFEEAIDILKGTPTKKHGSDIHRLGTATVSPSGKTRGGVGARGGIIDHITSSGNVVYKKRYNTYKHHKHGDPEYHKYMHDLHGDEEVSSTNEDEKQLHKYLQQYHELYSKATSQGELKEALAIGKKAYNLQQSIQKKKSAKEKHFAED